MKARTATLAALAAVAVASAGAAYAYSRRRKRSPQEPLGSPVSPAPGGAGDEPQEGFEARWEAQADAALQACQDDPEVASFAQAVTCALAVAYPEAAPWTDPASWLPWQEEAAELVRQTLLRESSRADGSPAAWEVALWLRGAAELDACGGGPRRRVALCAAQRMFPASSWTMGELEPWQRELVRALVAMLEAR